MSTPTLGYEDATTITKSEIARVQLERAIRLFLEGDFLCATTLAGAAEAVYAGILEDKGIPSVVEVAVSGIQDVRQRTNHSVLADQSNNEIFKNWNGARNDLKHHGKGKASVVSINVFDEAYWMIRRALSNAQALGTQIDNAHDFENWVVLNVNLE